MRAEAESKDDRMEILKRALKGIRQDKGKEAIGALLSASSSSKGEEEEEKEDQIEES